MATMICSRDNFFSLLHSSNRKQIKSRLRKSRAHRTASAPVATSSFKHLSSSAQRPHLLLRGAPVSACRFLSPRRTARPATMNNLLTVRLVPSPHFAAPSLTRLVGRPGSRARARDLGRARRCCPLSSRGP
jgi:hypothetical protein